MAASIVPGVDVANLKMNVVSLLGSASLEIAASL